MRSNSKWLPAIAFLLASHPVIAWADAGAAISKQGNDFRIVAPSYQATIDGATGMLTSLSIGEETAIEGTEISLENRKIITTSVVQESPTKVVAYISAQDGDKVADKALRISYEAEPTQLYVKTYSTVGRVSGRGMAFHVGKDAQMVRSLDFKELVPMPVLQPRSPWMRVKYYFASGATLGIINEGAGNPFNANENGGVMGYNYYRGGYVANSEYVYTLIPEPGAKRTLGSPSMSVLESSTPAVYWQGVPVQATLHIARSNYAKLTGLTGLRIKYTVQDTFENEVAKGEVPLDLTSGADPIEVKVTLPVTKLGWYRAYFTVNDAANDLLESQERLIFSVLKHLPNMGESFANQMQTDYTLGLGLTRESVPDQSADDLLKAVAQHNLDAQGTDVHISYAIDGPPHRVGNDPAKFGQYASELFTKVGDQIPRVEIINEPNGTLQPQQYIDTFLRPAYENIKKASPNTKVLGPVLCGISPDQSRYLQELYQLGLKNLTDELTFHPYAGNFDDGNAVSSMQQLMQVIAANGDSAKPIHFTEAGYGHGGWSELASLRESIKWLVSQYAWQNAVMDIDYQHNFYYFTDQMGYLDFWLRSNQLTPAAVAMRTYAGFVKGQGRAQKLDFGSLEDVRAFRFPGADRQVVALWTASNYDQTSTTPVSFKVSGGNGNLFDCFGNPLPVKAHDGVLSFDAGTFPQYLTLPANATIVPVAEHWGTNLALASLGAVAEATTEQGTQPAVSAIDGNTASETSWRSLNANELPQSITVTLAGPSTLDRAGIWSYSARGYDLDAMGADGKWVRLVSRRDQPYRRFRNEPFKPILTDQVRLTIVDSYNDRAEVAELQLFSLGAAAGKSMDLVNWALKSNGATATASSAMVKDISVAEQDWGAKKPRIVTTHVETKAENAIDGKRIIAGWREFYPTTWMATPGAALPQWLEVDFAGPKTISSVAVYTIAFASWTPESSGIRDWDVQAWDGNNWQTVDSVIGNVKVSKISRFKAPVKTDKIRILVKATNDKEGTVGIMEVEAYGPK